jgi:predicted small secreted protein
MKKLLIVLLVVALAAFLLVGCNPVTPVEGEGEGEGEVTVVITGAVVLDSKTYVSCGPHTITVTFPAPVIGGVAAYITCCTGDYSKVIAEIDDFECGAEVVLFPDAEKKVWTGSGDFGCFVRNSKNTYQCTPCCASYIEISSGACLPEACIKFPVIVDCGLPFAKIKVTSEACPCGGCEVTFESTSEEEECATATECCDDECSGLASWSIALYDSDPFKECCEIPCEEPISPCSGTACPILCVTDCLTEGGCYYAIVTLADKVGNTVEYYAKVCLDTACGVTVTDYYANVLDCTCTDWSAAAEIDTDIYIGYCEPATNCLPE